LEGSSSLVSKAAEHLKMLHLNNVVQVEGDITENLESVLSKLPAVDFVYIDANHQYDAVIDYFEKCLLKSHQETVFVLDDIYWSQGMEKAWLYVKNHSSVVSTIDVFYFGIVFLKKDLPPKHYRVRC
jgi:predicted O-methyltransferase YrrM